MCHIYDPVCIGETVVGGVAEAAASSGIGAFASAVTEGVGTVVASLGTLWVKVGTPNLTTTNGGATPSPTVGFLQEHLAYYMAAAAIMAVIVGGARMAWEQRAEPGRELVKALLTLVVVVGAGLAAASLAVSAADQFSTWIIEQSLNGGSFGSNITALLGFAGVTGTVGDMLVIVLGLLAIFASIVQIGLMFVRGGMLVILAGLMGVSAWFSNTEAGRTWFRKSIGWLVAFILYKPAAAIVYATAFRLAGENAFGPNGLSSIVAGLVLMLLAVVALPALMRFVTPMVAATAGSGAGVGGALAAGAAMALPMGAVRGMGGGASAAGAAAGGASSNGDAGAAGASGAMHGGGGAAAGGAGGGGGSADGDSGAQGAGADGDAATESTSEAAGAATAAAGAVTAAAGGGAGAVGGEAATAGSGAGEPSGAPGADAGGAGPGSAVAGGASGAAVAAAGAAAGAASESASSGDDDEHPHGSA